MVIGGDDSNTNACLLAENFRYALCFCDVIKSDVVCVQCLRFQEIMLLCLSLRNRVESSLSFNMIGVEI